MTTTIVHGDALALDLADESVDLVVTSPPYFGLRTYLDGGEAFAHQVGGEASVNEYLDALVAATAEMIRVLKPPGSIWVNLGDKYATATTSRPVSNKSTMESRHLGPTMVERPLDNAGIRPKSLVGLPWRYAIRCLDQLGLILRAEVVWHKPNALPESVTDRVRRSHETWFHFTRSRNYFANVDTIREPYVASQTGRNTESWRRCPSGTNRSTNTGRRHADGGRVADFALTSLGRLPGSVWNIATQPLKVPADLGVDHYAAFPMVWPFRLINGWCPPRGVVLDPFGGTGTTATVARALGRDSVTVDMSVDYCRVAAWRVTDPGQAAKVAKLNERKP